MSFEYLTDPEQGPQWRGLLPGAPEPFFLQRGEGEHARLFGDLFTVLLSGDETENQFGIIVSDSPAGDVIPTHSHNGTHETFYVLEGELLMHIDGRERSLAAGAFASVPAGLPHAYVVSSEAARSLIVITPGSGAMEAFFRDAGEPAAQRTLPPEGPLDIERIGAAAERTGAVKILGPPPFGA